MKSKILKIMGIALTLMLVFSLGALFSVAPVAAAPDEDAWDTYDLPDAGSDGDYFWDAGIGAVGPIDRGIDDAFWASVGIGSTATLDKTPSGNTATWSTTEKHSGSTSAELIYDGGLDMAFVYFAPPTGITLAEFVAAPTTYGFYYFRTLDAGIGPEMELKFTDGNLGWVRVTIEAALYDYINAPDTHDQWNKFTASDTEQCQYFGQESDGEDLDGAANFDLSTLITLIDTGGDADDAAAIGAWEMDNVQVSVGWGTAGQTAYIDDVRIDGITYDLEGEAGSDPGTALESYLMVSTDDGRSWAETDYTADIGGGTIVAIACSTEDEDVVYVATVPRLGNATVYKTEDGGDDWEQVGAVFNATITCMDVGYADDEPYVYVGTVTGADTGDVWYISDVAFGGDWTELLLTYAVYGIACSPDFDHDSLVAAVALDTTDSYVCINTGADEGDWTKLEILDDTAPIEITEAADPAFPEDFDEDDANEFFVATSDDDGGGHVYRVYEDTTVEELDDVVADIISLDLAGDQGDAYLLAGTEDTGDVWYSDDDGDDWYLASDEGINPAGSGPTYVICDEDIADDGMGWATTSGTGAGMHLTLTAGESWVGISLLGTDVATIVDLALSPAWAIDDTLFVLTTSSTDALSELYRYDGSNWERVWEDTQYRDTLIVDGALDLLGISPDFGDDETLYVALSTAPEIFLSEDGGTVFAQTRDEPDTLASWAIVDNDTIIAGGSDGYVYITDRQGRRAWEDYAVNSAAITSLAALGDTVICGNDDGDVYISEDFAETWDIVGARVGGDPANTYVAFDTDFATNSTIYAASDDTVARFLDIGDLTEEWEAFDTDLDLVATTTATVLADASGIAVMDGVLYASSADPTVAEDDDPGAGAVFRTVNPLEDVGDVDETEFDHMLEGLDEGEVFNILLAVEGSTVLFAVDSDDAIIYTLEDLLAVVATGGEADPGTTDFTLTWDGFDNATDYDVAVYSDEDMGLAYVCYDAATDDDEPVLIYSGGTNGAAVDAGTDYWWMVRATAPVNSKWSEVWTFTTLPGIMTIDEDMFGPAMGATDIPITPSFGWQLIEEADHYLFELSDDANFGSLIESATVTNPVYNSTTTLAYGTNYFWRVKAVSGTAEGSWATGTFTTMAKPVVAPAPAAPAAPPVIELPPAPEEIAPKWIYAIIGIGATLATVVIVLIVRTRKP